MKRMKILLLAVGITGCISTTGQALTLSFDVDKSGSVNTYSGIGVAPDTGTTWNSLPVVQDGSGDITIDDALDSGGNSSGVRVVMNRDGGGTTKIYDDSSSGSPNPTDLMRDYGYWDDWSVTLSGLPAGTYYVYGMGHQNSIGGTCTYSLDESNGGESAGTTESLSAFRDIFQDGAEGNTYVRLTATVDGSGTLSFTTTAGINGFQIYGVSTSEAPSITGLNDQAAIVGDDVNLTPSVTGAEPITYQWRENGLTLSGETNVSLTLSDVQLSLDGYVYSLVASNASGDSTNSMTLTVVEADPGTELVINVDLDKGSTYSGTAVAPDSGTKWNSFSSLGTLSSGSVKDSNNDTAAGVSIVFSSSDGSLSMWDDASSGAPNPLNLMRDYTYNRTYMFDVSGLPAGQQFALYVYAHGNVDNQNASIALDSSNGGDSGSTVQTADYESFRDCDVWGEGYNYVRLLGHVDGSGVVSFSGGNHLNGFQLHLLSAPLISGLSNQTVVEGTSAVLSPSVSGSELLSYQWSSNSVALVGETNATLELDNVQYAQNGTVYSLEVSNDAGSASKSMILSVIVTPAIEDLNNQAAAPGTTVVIAPTVSGIPAPDLQWYCNGAALDGETAGSLELSNVQESDSGIYSLVAANDAGMVTSSMVLTVSSEDVAPELTGPIDQTVVEGNDAVFSASAAGLPVPTLQWQQNGADIAGETNETLTVSSVQYAQDGDVYTLVASNAAGTDSASATLTVLVSPAISEQPEDLDVTVGGTAEFSVTV